MNKKLASLCWVLALVGSGPALWAQPDAISDLDALTSAKLEQVIMYELDDLFDDEMGFERNVTYPLDELEDAINSALSDEGDVGIETHLDYSELEAEMAELEGDITVKAVVSEALEGFGQSSYRQESPSSPIVLASSTGDTPWNAGLALLLPQVSKRLTPDKANCRVAISLVKKSHPGRAYQSGCRP